MSPSSTTVVPLGTCDKLFPRSPAPPDPTVREFSTGSKEGIPGASLNPSAITPGIPLPLPCQHPALGTPPTLTASFSVLQGHRALTKTTSLCKPFLPGRESVRQTPGAPCPRLCRCHRWPAGVRAGRGPAGTGREQVPMDKDRAGTGRSGRKQAPMGGKLVSRAAVDKEQPSVGREEATARRKQTGMGKNK